MGLILAVRNTQDVDILLRRQDLEAAASALSAAGFVRRHVAGFELFLDGSRAKARDALHIVLAGEKVKPDHHKRPHSGSLLIADLSSSAVKGLGKQGRLYLRMNSCAVELKTSPVMYKKREASSGYDTRTCS